MKSRLDRLNFASCTVHTVLSILNLIQRYRAVFKIVPVPKHSCEIGGMSLLVGSQIFTLHLYYNFSAVLDITCLLPQQLYCIIIMHHKYIYIYFFFGTKHSAVESFYCR